jgi:hypothetical protein
LRLVEALFRLSWIEAWLGCLLRFRWNRDDQGKSQSRARYDRLANAAMRSGNRSRYCGAEAPPIRSGHLEKR